MNTIAIVRGKFLNAFEMQSFLPLVNKFRITAFGSYLPMHEEFGFPIKKLWSPLDIHDFPFKMPIVNRLFVDGHYLLGLESALKGYDIAHTAETYYGYTQQCLNAKKKGYVKRVVCTVWENIPFNNEGIRGRKAFKERAYREVDLFLAISERAKTSLLLEGVSNEKIRVVSPGISLERFKRKTVRQEENRSLRILFVGRLEREKGVYELLWAFQQLVRADILSTYRLELMMIGDGRERSCLLEMEKRLGIDKFVIHNYVSYEHMSEEYARADIFVLPSKETRYWQEQWGMVLMEAQACGLPIVTTYSGSIPENVGKAALFVNPGDVLSLSDALKQYIVHGTLRMDYSRRSEEHAHKRHDIAITSAKIEGIYRSVLDLP